MPTDLELLDAWRDGDRSAGNTLFERHFDALYNFFRNKLNTEAVDDFVQRTFLGCIKGRDGFRADASFRTYMFAAARNILYEEFRRRCGGREEVDPSQTTLHGLDPSASAVIASSEDRRLLLEGLRRLPLDQQLALELYYFEGLRGPELAGVMGIPEPTVRGKLSRGIARLRKELAQLQKSPHLLASTLTDLDKWADALNQGESES